MKVDLCSECRGVWLDRGELDHLLEAAGALDDAPDRVSSERRPARAAGAPERREDRRDRDDDYDRRQSEPRNKRSWLSEILEFGE